MKKNFILISLLTSTIFCFFVGNSYGQNSNVTIAGATSGGAWSGTTVGPYTFTPTADNATVNAADILNRLVGTGFASNNVTIVTTNASGTQPGNITVSTGGNIATTTTTQRTLTFTAGGAIAINAAINLTPATPTGNTAGRIATNFTMSGTNITISAAVTATGGRASNGTFGSGGDGANAGNITINASGSFSSSAAGTLTAIGGAGVTGLVSSHDGGDGGIITINAASISLAGTINATGGGSVIVGNGGEGGDVTLNTAGTLSITGAITANGGGGVSAGGGDFFLTGTSGITLTANLTATGGGVGTGGSVTINDGAAAATSGGTNDGQTATSVINLNNLTKTGAGTFNIAGTNSYVGNTTINAGLVRVSSAVNTGASTNGALGNNGLLGIATITLSNAGIEFNNATFTRAITLSGNTNLNAYGTARSVSPALSGSGTLTVGANTVVSGTGQDLTLAGVISGSIALVKSFSSVLTLTATNTFTGTKTLNAGALNINNANALGTVAAAFTINGGALDNTTAAAITTLNYLQTWGGDFSFTGTQSLNLGTGVVTMPANRQVTVNANTLTIGGTLSSAAFNLIKAGAGTLAFGATAKTFNSLTISAGTLTSTSNTLSIAGDFNNSGTFTHNSGTTRFNGTTQSITGSSTTAFSTLTILTGSTTTGVAASTAVTFNINSGAKYIQQAGTTIPGTTKNFVSGSTYELQANAVTFSGSTYGNLILNYTAGNVSAGGTLTSVLNDLYVKNTGTGSFRLAAGTSPTVTIGGNLKVDAGTLNFSTGAGAPNVTVNGDVILSGGTFRPMTSTGIASLFIKGNWVNNGIFTQGQSNVTFNSTTAPQNISGSSSNTFYNLTNSNTDFSGLSLDGNITVTNVLTFASASNGGIAAGTNTVFVSNPATDAVVVSGSGYVIGNLKRSIAGTGGVFSFPVGSFSGFTPASLSFNNGNTAGDVNIITNDGVSVNYPFTLSATNQLARTWDITNGGAGSFNADAVFTFLPGDLLNGATDVLLKGYKFDAPSTYAYSANTSNTSNTFSFNGITSFSEFGAGECTGGLAVNSLLITNVTCNSGSDGAITTTVTGNTTPFTYSWNTTPVQTTPDISGLTAGFYTVTVTEETTCSASNTFEVTEPAAVPPPTSDGDQTVCSDGSPAQTLTATATSAFTVNWYTAPSGGSTVTPTQVGVGTSTYYAEAFDGTCSSLTRTSVTLTINPVPNAPVSGGDQTVCSDGTNTQTLTATASGGTITWYDAATAGSIVTPQQVGVGVSTFYAEASDGTCSSLTRTAVTLTINALPATPTVSVIQPTCATATGTITITAPTGVGFNYSIGAGYQSSPSFPGQTPGTYNNINVQDNNGCFSLNPANATVDPQPFVPAAPVVDGIVNVCPYIGTGDELVYTASAPGATSYNWILPPNVTLASGQGTSSLHVTIGNGFTSAQPNKQIRVTATSVCGTGTLTVFYLLAQSPVTPNPITGPTNVCALIGTATEATYIIPSTISATSYSWSIPPGTAINHPNGPGKNDTIVKLTFDNSFAGGPITVTAVNGCGTSGTRSLSIPRTPSSTPGLISGPTNVCNNILPGGTAAVYSVVPVPGATSYTWTAPLNSIVTHPNGAGPNDYTITIQFPAGFSNGTISVSSTNGCGTSGLRTLAVNKLNPATPSVMDVIQTGFCGEPGGRIYTYTLSAMPANASSVQWTVPTVQGAVLESGQGTTSITVSYPSTAVTGSITAQAINSCGSSTIRSSAVKLPACPSGFSKADIDKDGHPSPVDIKPLEAQLYPNPSVSDFKLKVLTTGNERINIRILDMQGRELKTLLVMPYQTINIGADLKAGSYLVEIKQGKNTTIKKIQKF